MPLRSLYIEGFGHFHRYALGPFDPGLVVLHGPNEAGKSTLSAFLLHVLFGARRGEVPVVLDGGRLGGRLTFDVAGDQVQIERIDKAAPTLRRGIGVTAGPATVEEVLRGVDRSLYRAVYAFSLDDLRSFDNLGEAELRDRLFTGALAGAGRSVSEAVGTLDRRARDMWLPRGACRIRELTSRRAAVDAELASARRQTEEIERKERDAADADRDHRHQTELAVRAGHEAQRWRALIAALPHHEEHRSAVTESAALSKGIDVPPATLDEAERLSTDLTVARARLEISTNDVGNRTKELAALPPLSGLAAHALALQALEHRASAITPQTVIDRADALTTADDRLKGALADAGLPDVTEFDRVDLSTPRQDTLRRLAVAAVAQGQRRTQRAEQRQLREGLVAERDRLASEAGSLPRDPEALAANAAIEALRRDHATVEAARQAAPGLGERLAKTRVDTEHLRNALGPLAVDASGDLAARSGLATEARALQNDRVALDARLAHAEAQLTLCEAAVETARAAMAGFPDRPGAAPSEYREVVDTCERALLALQQADDAHRRSLDAVAQGNDILSLLGGPWSAEVLANAHIDPATLDDLRAVARRNAEAVSACASQSAEVDALQAEARQSSLDADAPGPSVAVLQGRLDAIEDAEIAVRSRHEQAAQGAPRAAPFPAWVTIVVIALGILLLLVGIGGLATGAVVIGALVTALGVIVLLVVLASLALTVARAAGSTEASPRPGASAAQDTEMTRLGLPASASAADLQRLRRDTQREYNLAALRHRHARARATLEERRGAADEARHQWVELLPRVGWPSALLPNEFERAAGQVLRARDSLARANTEAARAKEEEGIWLSWLRRAIPASTALGVPVPRDGEAARSLVEALRRAQQADEEHLRHRQNALQGEKTGVAALEEARRVHAVRRVDREDVSQRLDALRAKATRLGVPADLDLDVAPAWLGDAARLRELLTTADALGADAKRQQSVVAEWDRRFDREVREGLGLDGVDALERAADRCRQAESWRQAAHNAEGRVQRAAEALQTHDAAQARNEAAISAHVEDEGAWEDARREANMPVTVSTAALDVFFDAARRARDAAREQRAAREAHTRAEADAQGLVDAVGALAAELGDASPPTLAEARAWLQGAAVRAAEERTVSEHADRLRHSSGTATALADEQRLFCDALDASLTAVLNRFGASSIEGLRQSAADHQRYSKVLARSGAARVARDATLGRYAADPDALTALDRPEEGRWQANGDVAEAQARTARLEANAALERRTTLDMVLRCTPPALLRCSLSGTGRAADGSSRQW